MGELTSGCAEAGAEAARMRPAYGGGSADRPEAGGSTAMSCSYGRSGWVDAGHGAASAAAPAPPTRSAAMSPSSGA